jgi:hypothetical protein
VREGELARLLLVQACEEGDPEARFVSRAEREQAGGAAAHAADDLERFLALRAARLAAPLAARWTPFRLALRVARLGVPTPAVVGAALLLGLAADRLGGGRHINLLAFPLLGLLGWNLAVYAALALAPLARRVRRAGAPEPGVAGALARWGVWAVSPERPWMAAGPAEETRWVVAALRRFLALWLARAGGLLRARARALLHLGAAALAGGTVLGMYLRGLAFEYRATWESTFLGAGAVHWLLAALLGPAARVLDTLAPAAGWREALRPEALERLRAPADGEAAVWIHLWAVTLALAVVAPRLLLAWTERRRASRLEAALAPSRDDPYVLRILAPSRGAGLRVEVIPYGYRPGAGAAARVGELLLALFGSRAVLRVAAPIAYSGDVPALAGGDGVPREEAELRVVVVFSLAQSPEPDVQGAFLETLKQSLERRGSPSPGALLVLLDEEPYRARLGAASARVAERRRAWERLAAECGLPAVAVPGEPVEADQALAAARAALRPAGEAR